MNVADLVLLQHEPERKFRIVLARRSQIKFRDQAVAPVCDTETC